MKPVYSLPRSDFKMLWIVSLEYTSHLGWDIHGFCITFERNDKLFL